MDEVPPAQRLGPYALGPKAGAGGMGVVFRAEHVETGAIHAVKCLLPGVDAEDVARSRREAEAMARVDGHANVVRVHSVGDDPRRPWVAMEWCGGGGLDARLRAGPLPIDEVVALGRALASGLAHVHARGVLHRDLKPSNVMFDESGAPKLTDFGLARLAGAGSLTATGVALGTPVYMAPEQAEGSKDLDPRTDVYGLGAVLYHALTGRAPVGGASIVAVLEAVMTQAPVAPRALRPDTPAWLERVVLRALAKRRDERFADAASLGAALVAATPRRRRPAILVAGGLLATVLAVVASARRASEPGVVVTAPDAVAAVVTGAATLAEVERALRAGQAADALDLLGRLGSGADAGQAGRLRALALLLAGDPAAGEALLRHGGRPGVVTRLLALEEDRRALDAFAVELAGRARTADFQLSESPERRWIVDVMQRIVEGYEDRAHADALGPADGPFWQRVLTALHDVEERVVESSIGPTSVSAVTLGQLRWLASAARMRQDEQARLEFEVLAHWIRYEVEPDQVNAADVARTFSALGKDPALTRSRWICAAALRKAQGTTITVEGMLRVADLPPLSPRPLTYALARLVESHAHDAARTLQEVAYTTRPSTEASRILTRAIALCDGAGTTSSSVAEVRAGALLQLGRDLSADDLLHVLPRVRSIFEAERALVRQDWPRACELYGAQLEGTGTSIADPWTGLVVASRLAGRHGEAQRLRADLPKRLGDARLPWRTVAALDGTLKAIEAGSFPAE